MPGAPYLSVVVPVFEEADNLEPLHAQLTAALDAVPGGVEWIYVDDGSRDATPQRLRELAKRDPRVRILTHAANCGQTAALDAGFRAAQGEVVATLDADLQNDPADLPRLLRELARADVVNGVREQRMDGWVRRVSSRIGNGFRNWITGESVSDVGCSLRVMRTRYLRQVKLFRGMHRFLPTLLRMEGARVVEVPVNHRPRRHGVSKYGIANRALVGLVDVLAVRWMQRRALDARATETTPPRSDAAGGDP